MSKTKLRICHVNAQSILPKFSEFKDFFLNNIYHIICISESWLKSWDNDEVLEFEGYSCVRNDRCDTKRGGGIIIYVINDLKCKVLHKSTTIDEQNRYKCVPEFLLLEILSGRDKLLLASIYRPPQSSYPYEFEEIVLESFISYENLVIIGDLNIDLVKIEGESARLKGFVTSSNLHILPFKPTHNLEKSSSWIDHCIVDCGEKCLEHGQLGVSFLSAHDLVYVEYNIQVINNNETRMLTYRSFKDFSLNNYLWELGTKNWEEVFLSETIDEKVSVMNDLIVSTLDNHAPIKKIKTRKQRITPWVNDNLKSLMKARDKAHRIWKSRKTKATYTRFKTLRNECCRSFKELETKYYTNKFAAATNQNEKWTLLRKLRLIRNNGQDKPLNVDPNELNEYFSNIGNIGYEDENAEIPSLYLDSPPENAQQEFNFTEPNQDELTSALSSASSQSVGVDGISFDLISKSLPSIKNILLHIFTFSFMTGTFPSLWKSALICPIPKIKNPISFSDYRPISLLCSVSKLFEKIAVSQIIKYLESQHKLDPYQSAYRKNHGTHTSLHRLIYKARKAANDHKVSIMVFFDFSKAFDRVEHDTLIKILRSLHFSELALKWIKSYLTNRNQAIKISPDKWTSWSEMNRGVPQGSVLGPLLFSLYIICFRKILHYCSYNIYADDIHISFECSPGELHEGIMKVNDDITRIVKWAKALGLLLNNSKTKAMIVGTHFSVKNINLNEIPKINVDGCNIPFSTEVKHLGIILKNDLSWNREVESKSKKVFATLHKLKFSRHILPSTIRIQLVKTLIFPIFDYCCTVMCDMTQDSNAILQRSLNSCLRFACNVRRRDHVTPHYTRLGWMKIDVRRRFFMCCLIYKVLKNNSPIYMLEGLKLRRNTITRTLRIDPLEIYIPFCKLEFLKKSFFIMGPEIWNALPLQIRQQPSFLSFKKHLRNLLMSDNCHTVLATSAQNLS